MKTPAEVTVFWELINLFYKKPDFWRSPIQVTIEQKYDHFLNIWMNCEKSVLTQIRKFTFIPSFGKSCRLWFLPVSFSLSTFQNDRQSCNVEINFTSSISSTGTLNSLVPATPHQTIVLIKENFQRLNLDLDSIAPGRVFLPWVLCKAQHAALISVFF